MIMMEKAGNQPPQNMHFCKVCKKGFSCGGALGGHMRAHGVEEVINSRNKIEENFMNEVEDKIEGNKRPYFLRTTTNRLVSYRAREDCGKSYLTWNSLVEHGKYSLDDTPMSLTGSFKRSTITEEKYSQTRTSREEKDLANFLVMLSNGKVNDHQMVVDPNDDSFTLTKNEEDQNKAREGVKGKFQCKACKKVFNSHQALGGHRASHKKVKGCFAARVDSMDDDVVHEDDMDNVIIHDDLSPSKQSPKHTMIDLNHTSEASPLVSNLKKNMKVHECSICHRVFSSGQALGGHKRCHWLTSNMPAETYNSIPQFHGFEYDSPQTFKKAMFEKSEPLDLNLPALFDDASEDHNKDHNPSKYGALSRIYQMPVAEEENHKKTSTNHAAILDDLNSEENFEMKVAKMSDLREMNLFGECSTWLQMGIAPTVEGRTVS